MDTYQRCAHILVGALGVCLVKAAVKGLELLLAHAVGEQSPQGWAVTSFRTGRLLLLWMRHLLHDGAFTGDVCEAVCSMPPEHFQWE